MKRDLAKDATLTLPGVTRLVGRPRTGKAKTAAERMRSYRQRREDQVNEFPSRVTETVSLPSELPTLPSVPKGAPQMQIVVSAPRVFRPVMESAYFKYMDESGEQIPFAEFLGLVLAAGLDGF